VNLLDRVRANMRHLLEAKGWTYGDLGFPRQYVCHFLRGDYGASASRLDEFAAAFGVDVAELCILRPEFKETRTK